ncbi:hypothetical protein B0H63DRAFT_469719 [Podospora didyma]|uniref:Geranylgeranyl transferase type-2 subunit alpha n=1 Tax=Podospora didyma TaxID=330526 RepID=A0AAE0NTL9_9PEZI|nr:hypothetical protein B0H63DRAFT_469719 [Podospora didyma]
MADQGGSQHGIARTSRVRTEAQKQAELGKIKDYLELESQLRSLVAQDVSSPEVFKLTSRLLRLNPEYYTIWNVRRRSLISSLLSESSPGSSLSKASATSSATATTPSSSAVLSSSSSTATLPSRDPPKTGPNGTTADGAVGEDGAPESRQPQQINTVNESDGLKTVPEDKNSQKNLENLFKSELLFTIPLLLESPKCYWIWSYRLWILRQAIEHLLPSGARLIWEDELKLASKMLIKDKRNFHAWGYRRQVVSQLESIELEGSSMAEAEFAYTTKMVEADLSNFSAWHSRSKLIPRVLSERKADDVTRKDFLEKELNILREALNVGPEDQSLWYYHQFLMLNLVDFVGHSTIAPGLTIEDRVTYVTCEIDFIKDLLEDYDDVKSIYEALLDDTLLLSQLEERKPDSSESSDLAEWLRKLKELDPMRDGRWNDVERDYGLKGEIIAAGKP